MKEVISQKMQQVCDACGKKHEWELVGADQNAVTLAEMQEWFTIRRKAVIDGALQQLSIDACSVTCVPAAALKLLLPPLPPPEEPADNIDLASLRTPQVN
jgi:hypothetical protein